MAITVRQNKPGGYVVLNTSATDFVRLNHGTDAAAQARQGVRYPRP